jgi:uncharacterized oxidoreductase
MPTIAPNILAQFTTAIFSASDIPSDVARQVADSLVLANLSGHDSHGVIRVIEYIDWTARGWINPQGKLTVVREQPCILILDGGFQFGQVIGRQAMELGIAKAKAEGACILSLKRSAHLGRVGEFMEQAAAAGVVCFAFTNTHGAGVLVAPYGGCERRLSANPLVAAAPLPDGPNLIMDMSTSTIAEGKIKVARSKGEPLPPGMIVNGQGEPSTSPEEYYGDPPGSLLPFGGHKGFALSLCCEVMAGAMTGAGCSKQGVDRVANGFMAFLLNPETFAGEAFVSKELGNLVQWVKSSRVQAGFDHIQTPGEPEARAREARRNGIEIDEATWKKICSIAATKDVAIPTSFTQID